VIISRQDRIPSLMSLAAGRPRIRPPGGPLGHFLLDPGALFFHAARLIAHLAATDGPTAGPALAAAAVVLVGLREWLGRRRHAAMRQGARQVIILAPPEVDPDGAAALWLNLAGLLRSRWTRLRSGQPHLAFEYAWDQSGLVISMWIPGPVPVTLVQRAIEAAWPAARTTVAPAGALLPDGAPGTGGTLRLARPEVLPVRVDHHADPLRALIGGASGLHKGEHAVVQVLARPATGERLRRARHAGRRLRAGQQPRRLSALFDLLTHQPARAGAAVLDPQHTAEVRAAVQKAASPQWEVLIRYAAAVTGQKLTAPTRRERRQARAQAMHAARSRAGALASAFALFSGWNWFARHRLHRPVLTITIRRMRRGDLLSVQEIAAIAHLPADDVVPGLSRAGARPVPPPPQVPTAPARQAAATLGATVHAAAEPAHTSPGSPAPSFPGTPSRGSDASSTVKPLGDTDAGVSRPVGITVPDARHHLHIIGATGSGKSTLMVNMILADIAAGRGLAVVDPKGDMITDLLARIPAHAAGRVALLDPDDSGPVPSLNVLDGPVPELAAEHLVSIFRIIYADTWGPRTDDIFRAAVLTLLTVPSSGPGGQPSPAPTLADVPRLLTDERTRAHYAAALHRRKDKHPGDSVLAGFWSWYAELSDGARAQAIAPLMNKLRAFLLRTFPREVIAAGPSTVDMGEILDHGGIVLARLPKGLLGSDTVALLGSMIVARIWQAVTHRASQREAARQDAALYLDEAHNFLTLPHSLDDMLAEARAYRMSFVLAHHNLAQLPARLREGISVNARSKIFFTASPEDAAQLARHTLPSLTAHDLSHLDAYQAAARLVTSGSETAAFTLRTRPAPPPVPGRATLIRQAARERYGRRPADGQRPEDVRDQWNPAA
jgi:hypothetical protein